MTMIAIPYIPDEQDRQVADMFVTSIAWSPDVLFYISGFIANKLCKTVKYPNCPAALFEPPDKIQQHCKPLPFYLANDQVNYLFHPLLSSKW